MLSIWNSLKICHLVKELTNNRREIENGRREGDLNQNKKRTEGES